MTMNINQAMRATAKRSKVYLTDISERNKLLTTKKSPSGTLFVVWLIPERIDENHKSSLLSIESIARII